MSDAEQRARAEAHRLFCKVIALWNEDEVTQDCGGEICQYNGCREIQRALLAHAQEVARLTGERGEWFDAWHKLNHETTAETRALRERLDKKGQTPCAAASRPKGIRALAAAEPGTKETT